MERSNTYVFIYAIVLVVIVAAVLSFTAYSLKDRQIANVENEKRENILATLQIPYEGKDVQDLYNKYVTESFIIKPDGNTVPYIIKKEGKSIDTVYAFDLNLKDVYSKPESDRNLPLYKASVEGKTVYVIPLRGKGLWGPIWGYISLKEDLSTVFGVVFDHKGETPGLGAEISNESFMNQFPDKKIFNKQGEFKSIEVIKGGAKPNNPHGVDAVSGGTITSNGVTNMLQNSLEGYLPFLQSHKK
ncbi:MAG: NADH:ubiquinone reductase (Na(+)-transporting) subunit C [Bacteroidales bacterium]